jgi:hypothetical protein
MCGRDPKEAAERLIVVALILSRLLLPAFKKEAGSRAPAFKRNLLKCNERSLFENPFARISGGIFPIIAGKDSWNYGRFSRHFYVVDEVRSTSLEKRDD